MDVVGVLHMNGGEGITSYAQNSWVAQQALLMTKSIREEAIRTMYRKTFPTESLVMADLGCSSGPIAMYVVDELIQAISNFECYSSDHKLPDLNFYLNDLPSNDFNTIFKSLPGFQERVKKNTNKGSGNCQRFSVYGAPGSFYERLFDNESVHFFHSSYAIHWLSKVPEGLGKSHKKSIYMSSMSPPEVLDAYYQQYQSDFSTFLKYRSKELVNKGCMVLTTIGRKSDNKSIGDGGSHIWDLVSAALNQLVLEGMIEEEKVDIFNIPVYHPSVKQVKMMIVEEGSFVINHLEVFEIDWDGNPLDHEVCNDNMNGKEYDLRGEDTNTTAQFAKNESVSRLNLATCIKAVSEHMVVDHFGEEISEEVFKGLNVMVADIMAKEKHYYYNITISLTKN